MPRACPPAAPLRATTRAEVEAALDELGAPVRREGRRPRRGQGRASSPTTARPRSRTPTPTCRSGAVLVEEFLAGPEVSLFFLSDGDHVLPLSPAQDYKRLARRRRRPEHRRHGRLLAAAVARRRSSAARRSSSTSSPATSPSPSSDSSTPRARPFIGLLYAGLILTDAGRQGHRVQRALRRPRDPGRAAAARRPALASCCWPRHPASRGSARRPAFADAVAVTVVLASEGYPQAPITGRRADGLDAAAAVDGVHLAHAATRRGADGLVATGGRVLNVVGARHDVRRGPRPHLPRPRRDRASRAASTAPTSPRASWSTDHGRSDRTRQVRS